SILITLSFLSFFLSIPRPPISPLFPYTTLFRSHEKVEARSLLHFPLCRRFCRDGCVSLLVFGLICSRRLSRRWHGRTGGRTDERSGEDTAEIPPLTKILFRLFFLKKKKIKLSLL